MPQITVEWDKSQISHLETKQLKAAIIRALRKAGMTALRDMRTEATKRVMALKRLSRKYVNRALTMARPRGGDIQSLEWALNVGGKSVPLIAYPHRAKKRPKMGKRRQGPRDQGGVIVEVNPGKKTLVRGAFVQTMSSGHEGIFRRTTTKKLPIKELFGSRPVDALMHSGQAQGVAARGGKSLVETYHRLVPMEIAKGKK